jgi:hypothetical protein
MPAKCAATLVNSNSLSEESRLDCCEMTSEALIKGHYDDCTFAI